MKKIAGIVAVLCTVAALSACSVTVGSADKTVDRAKLEQKVSQTLAEKTGQTPKSVTCPDALKAKVDAITRCTLTADDGSQIGANVTVTSVNGDDVNFDIKVDDQPKTTS